MTNRGFSQGSKLMLAAMLAAAVLSRGPVSAQDVPAQDRSGLEPLVFPADQPITDKAALGKQAMDAALESYATESEAALDARLAELKAFFDERKSATRGFARSMLGIEGKVMVGGNALQDFFDAASGKVNKPSELRTYVGDRFRAEVLNPAMTRRAVDAAVSGFLGDLAGIEGRLLVRLKADIGDGELVVPTSLPDMGSVGKVQYDALIGSTIDAALTDIGVSMGMFVVSNYVGSKIVDSAAPKDASSTSKFIANFLVGIAVDAALDEVAKQAGYEPAKKLEATADAGIDRIRQSVIDGDPAVSVFYPKLRVFRRMHPHQAVRDACGRADEAVKRTGNIGLRERLRGLRNDRYRRLWVVLTARIVSEEAAKSPLLMYTPLDAEKSSPPDDIIKWADQITAAFGGTR